MILDDKTKAAINEQVNSRGLVTAEDDEDAEIHVDRVLKIRVIGAAAEVTMFASDMTIENVTTVSLDDLGGYLASKLGSATVLTC